MSERTNDNDVAHRIVVLSESLLVRITKKMLEYFRESNSTNKHGPGFTYVSKVDVSDLISEKKYLG